MGERALRYNLKCVTLQTLQASVILVQLLEALVYDEQCAVMPHSDVKRN